MENDRHEENQRLIDESCGNKRSDCKNDPRPAPDCIRDVGQQCSSQENEEFRRHIRAMKSIEDKYPINIDLKNLCDMVP